MPGDRKKAKQVTAEIAAEYVFIATFLWKCGGGFGKIYTSPLYEPRGKVVNTHFERKRLGEHLILKDGVSFSKVSL